MGTAGKFRPKSRRALLGRGESHAGPAHGASQRQSGWHVALTPADLYSNCTLALDPKTGKLIWYYQHLPGDDWDTDHTHERTLARVAFNPNPKFVKWINPDGPRGSMHDIAAMVAEGGTIFVLDRNNGQFLWAMPFPYDDPNYIMSDIDVKTGKTKLNWDLVFKQPGDHHITCYWNTRSYWPTAYHEATNRCLCPTSTTAAI